MEPVQKTSPQDAAEILEDGLSYFSEASEKFVPQSENEYFEYFEAA